GGFAGGDPLHEVEDLAAHFVELRALQDAAGVHVHVVAHALESVRVRAHLDDRRDGGTDHRAAAGGEQDQVRTAGDQFDDLGVVGDVGESEARFAVRYHVEQVQAAARRDVAGLDEPGNRRRSGFRIRAHGLL